MKDLLKFLEGKRTYGFVGLAFLCFILKKHGVEVPDELTAALVMLAVVSLRAAVPPKQ